MPSSASVTGTRSPVAPSSTTHTISFGSPRMSATQADRAGSSSERGVLPQPGAGALSAPSARRSRCDTLAPVTGVSRPRSRGGGTAPVATLSSVADASSVSPWRTWWTESASDASATASMLPSRSSSAAPRARRAGTV